MSDIEYSVLASDVIKFFDCIRHKIKDVSPLRVAALTCNITLYTLPPKIALSVPDTVSTMTGSYILAC